MNVFQDEANTVTKTIEYWENDSEYEKSLFWEGLVSQANRLSTEGRYPEEWLVDLRRSLVDERENNPRVPDELYIEALSFVELFI